MPSVTVLYQWIANDNEQLTCVPSKKITRQGINLTQEILLMRNHEF